MLGIFGLHTVASYMYFAVVFGFLSKCLLLCEKTKKVCSRSRTPKNALLRLRHTNRLTHN